MLLPVAQFPFHALKVIEPIAQGSSSDVSLVAANAGSIQRFAIKTFLLKSWTPSLVQEFFKDAQFLARASCPQIVRVSAVSILENTQYSILMEKIKNGTLSSFLKQKVEVDPWPLNISIALDIAKGLSYLHSQDVKHRDLKSDHILLDKTFHAKICGIGFTQIKIDSAIAGISRPVSIRWRSPESFRRGHQPSFASDVFSLGMILFELASRKIPYSDDAQESVVMTRITSGETDPIPRDCPESFAQLIQSCCDVAVEKRPTALQLIEIFTNFPKIDSPRDPTQKKRKSWHFDPLTQRDVLLARSTGNYQLLEATESDFNRAKSFYDKHPVPGHEIASVKVIYNRSFNTAFECYLKGLQFRANDPNFSPSWKALNSSPQWREKTLGHLHELSKDFTDPDYPDVMIIPAWHGTKPEILDSIFKVGYSNLAVTDCGFFGKGLYSACEADYAHSVYYKGALIFNWVACFSAFPVIGGDMGLLVGAGNYGNHDCHFVPVVAKPVTAKNYKEDCYIPCKENQEFKYREVVVFQTAACLPRFLVELKCTIPPVLSLGPLLSPLEHYLKANDFFIQSKYRDCVKHFRLSADAGFAASILRLGCMIRTGETFEPKNILKSDEYFRQISSHISWFESACEKGESDGLYNLGLFHFNISKDLKQAATCFLLAAKAGHVLAIDTMGMVWKLGIGRPRDEEMAFRFFCNAADMGLAQGHCNKGLCLSSGIGCVENHKSAFESYKKASELEYAPGFFYLGVSYKTGKGVERDEIKAMECYYASARLRYAPAQFNLAVTYQTTKKDQGMAMKYYQLAADQGFVQAQYNLGVGYATGVAVAKDDKAAAVYFQAAADEGYAPAQRHLGLCYQKGIGVPKKKKLAFTLFQAAADQGDARGQYSLGMCYVKGSGVDKNEKVGINFLTLAANQGLAIAQQKLQQMNAEAQAQSSKKGLLLRSLSRTTDTNKK